MNLKNIFKIGAVIMTINGISLIFTTAMFMEMANMEMSPSLLTIGQFMGVTFLAMALIAWKTADLANDALPAFGQVYAIAQVMWVAIIGYHVAIGAASGPTAYANLGVTAILGVLFFFYSKK